MPLVENPVKQDHQVSSREWNRTKVQKINILVNNINKVVTTLLIIKHKLVTFISGSDSWFFNNSKSFISPLRRRGKNEFLLAGFPFKDQQQDFKLLQKENCNTDTSVLGCLGTCVYTCVLTSDHDSIHAHMWN